MKVIEMQIGKQRNQAQQSLPDNAYLLCRSLSQMSQMKTRTTLKNKYICAGPRAPKGRRGFYYIGEDKLQALTNFH